MKIYVKASTPSQNNRYYVDEDGTVFTIDQLRAEYAELWRSGELAPEYGEYDFNIWLREITSGDGTIQEIRGPIYVYDGRYAYDMRDFREYYEDAHYDGETFDEFVKREQSECGLRFYE